MEGPREPRRDREARPPSEDRDREIVIRLPRLDPSLREFCSELVPWRGLFRILADMPEDALVHMRNARRERLLAMRSLLDAMIEDTEQRPRGAGAREVPIE